jgi:hypothetical protein
MRWTSLLVILILGWKLPAQQQTGEPRFIVNPNHPYLYIQLDHFGPGTPRNDDEAENRVWLRLANNCTVSIQIVVNGFPEDHKPADEIAIQDLVVEDPPPFITSDPPLGEEAKASKKPSYGYWIDVGSDFYIRPGKSVLFSLPTSQFAKGWHIEIPFEFAVPRGKGPRPDNVGGQPVMHLEYSLWDLPKDIQQKIEKENAGR